jgi:type II secretory pathway pseudopilin PulG
MKQKTFHTLMTSIGIMVIALLLIIATLYMNTSKDDDNKVCMTVNQFENMQRQQQQQVSVKQQEQQIVTVRKTVQKDRDVRVLEDPLYPPLNRTDRDNFDRIDEALKPLATTDVHDSFRLIGYLKSTSMERDAGGNTWKLFGRMKDRHQGEFYITPANNLDDVKIPLTQEIVVGQRLRDIDTIPNELRFKSPLLNDQPYLLVELPKSDLPSRYM